VVSHDTFRPLAWHERCRFNGGEFKILHAERGPTIERMVTKRVSGEASHQRPINPTNGPIGT
jgi:hypothetical protein